MSMIRLAAVALTLLAVSVTAEDVTSPMYALAGLPGRIDWAYGVQWRYITNSASAGGDFVAVHLSWKAGRYAAFGFSPVNMAGYITACHVPSDNATQAVCTDVIGFNGGGITKNPSQYSRLLWARVNEDGNVEAEVEVPVSAVNISSDAAGNTRMIFAASTWNSTSNLPEPHGAKGKCILHVNLNTGSVSDSDYPIATAASHVFQPFSNYGMWWYAVFNGTNGADSYLVANYMLTGTNWAGLGFASQGMNGRIVICHWDSMAECYDYDGFDYGIKKAVNQVTSIEYAISSSGVNQIGVKIPLNYSAYTINNALTDMVNRTIFATSTWDSKTHSPNPHNASGHAIRYINLFNNEVFSSDSPTYVTFPEVYYTSFALISAGAGYGTLKLRVALTHLTGFYAGFGFANTSMGGPLVACYTPADASLQVVCRDFIGGVSGGVTPNPEQSTLIITSLVQAESGYTTTIVDIDLAKFNISTESALSNSQRVIQAYGTWDSSTNRPTYHGPNATYYGVNLLTGATNGTYAPTTLAPADLGSSAMKKVESNMDLVKKYLKVNTDNLIHIGRKN